MEQIPELDAEVLVSRGVFDSPRYLPAHKVYLETAVNLTPKGYCQWCGESLEGTRSRRFCPPVKIDYYPYKKYECALMWFYFWQGTPTFKRAVMIRDKFTCQLCGVVCVTENKYGVKIPELGRIEIDHIVPVAKGGKADLDNLQTLCFKCNRGKGSKLPTDSRQIVLDLALPGKG